MPSVDLNHWFKRGVQTMVRVGLVGIGFMGWIHTLAYRKVAGAKVVAYCEQNQKRLAGDWTDIKGNFGPPGEQMDMSPYKCYTELEAMLADPEIDMVDLCLPPGGHAAATVKAFQAGKHVFCEKPIALQAADAKAMVQASADSGKQLLIGHVLPFFPEFTYAYQAVTSGKYGKLLGGHFKRIISDPSWLPHFYDPDKIGGPMLDLHVHDAHFIRLLFGMPNAVQSTGRMRGEVAEFFTSLFQFSDPSLSVTATSGVIRQQGRSFTHGYEIHLEDATLVYDFSVIDGKPELSVPLTLLAADGSVTRPELPASAAEDPFAGELNEAVRAIESGKPSAILGGQLACDALSLCEAQTRSVRERSLVKI
jgi:predicted dehydrogenase